MYARTCVLTYNKGEYGITDCDIFKNQERSLVWLYCCFNLENQQFVSYDVGIA